MLAGTSQHDSYILLHFLEGCYNQPICLKAFYPNDFLKENKGVHGFLLAFETISTLWKFSSLA